MKRIISFGFLVVHCMLSYSQQPLSDNTVVSINILSADTLVRGIYMNFEEFQQNSPSVTADFKSEEEKIPVNSIYNNMLVSRLFAWDENGYVPVNPNHWGICDGENVFINYNGKYQKVSLDGKFALFTIAVYSLNSQRLTDYLLDVTNNKKTQVFLSNVEELLLKENRALYDEFKKDKHKKMMLYTYINRLNKTYNYQ